MFPVDAKAVDTPGGVGVQKIAIYADGKLERSFGDGHALMRRYWDSREWRIGSRHRITFKAWDEAGNMTSKSVRVTKVRRLPKVRTAASIAVEQLDPATVRVTGRVTTVDASLARKLRGKVFVVFQRKVGGDWKTFRRIDRRVRRAVDVTQRLAPGSWRVFLKYPGRRGVSRTRSRSVAFQTAPVV
jgi:hypothetical protein